MGAIHLDGDYEFLFSNFDFPFSSPAQSPRG